MDGCSLSEDGKEFPQDHGLSRALDLGRDPQRIEVCHPTGGGVVTWARTAAPTFNYGRATLVRSLVPAIFAHIPRPGGDHGGAGPGGRPCHDLALGPTIRAHVESANSPRDRSEERRVGKECRSRWSPYH